MKSLFSLNKYLWNYKVRLFAGTVFIFGSNFFDLLKFVYIAKTINVIKDAFGVVLGKEDNKSALILLFTYGGISIGMSLLSGVFRFAMRQTIIVTSRYVEYDLKNNIYNHYQKLPLSFYKKNKTGDLMNRISEDVSHVRMYLGPGIMYTINLVSLFVIFMSYMFYRNAELALYTLAPLPILSYLIYRVSAIINKQSRQVQEKQSSISSFVQDSFSGIRIIKSYNQEKSTVSDYLEKTSSYREKALSLAKTNAYFFPLMLLLIGLSYTFILYNGGMQFINGNITELSVLLEFFLFVGALAWPFTALGWVTSVVQSAEASQKRINEFLDEEPKVKNTSDNKEAIKGTIVFNNVSFKYKNTNIQALKNISFDIAENQTVTILGKTGSGKSTLAQLLARLYEPDSGQISIDRKQIENFNLSSLRKQIGFVPQESFLFSDTIANNINFGVDDKSEELVISSAKSAAVHDNIIRFKNKYETLVGERGITLSGGQKQRISIARAIAKDPRIMIFDDSLSAVDTETEEKILSNIIKSSRRKTTIIISHRVSSAINADKIIYLEDGEIKEMGEHDSLMLKRGEYYNLYKIQLAKNVN